MTTLREAAQMALDALETYGEDYMHGVPKRTYIKALRTALAQPEKEEDYEAVAKKEWQGLTPEEAKEISLANRPYVIDMIAALEKRLKEKNSG